MPSPIGRVSITLQISASSRAVAGARKDILPDAGLAIPVARQGGMIGELELRVTPPRGPFQSTQESPKKDSS